MRERTTVRSRTSAARRRKRRPSLAGSLVWMAVLLAVSVGALYGAWTFRRDYGARRAEQKRTAEEIRTQLVADRQELVAMRSGEKEEVRRQAAERQSDMEAKRREAETLESAVSALDATIQSVSEKLEEQKKSEDYAYYREIYDSYMEGKYYVEELLTDH